jgi:hypothetical protein
MGVGDLAIHLFSPAKLAYMAYVLVVVLGKTGQTTKWEFGIVSGLFLLVQIAHDDYLRIWLNRKAEK